MNICMMTNTYRPHIGGVAHSVANLAGILRERGHRVLIVAPTFASTASGNAHPVEPDLVRVSAIQNFNGSDFSVRLPVPFQLNHALDDFQPDLIHSHHPFLLGDTALRAARHYRTPLIFTHHTLYERYTHYVPLDSPTLQSFAVQLSTEYANLCDAVVAPSESVAGLVRSRGVRSPVRAIPTGVDLDFFRNGRGDVFRRSYGIDLNARVIGHVGRLAREKNLSYLAEAVSTGLQQDPTWRFIMVGDGPDRNKLESLFAAKGVSGQVIFTGSCSGVALADAYRAMDLFVFSSQTETQGMVIAEAMAAGIPVLALDASGVREVVIDRYNGRLLAADSSIDEFSCRLRELLTHPGLDALFATGIASTAERLSRERTTSDIEKLYRNLLSSETIKLAGTGNHRDHGREIGLLSGKLQAEWELVSQKAAAVFKTIRPVNDKPDNKTEP